MRSALLLTICLLCLTAFGQAQETSPDELTAVGEGVAVLRDDAAAAQEEALWDAKRSAVERAAGILLKSRAVGRDYALESDRIEAQTGGFVRRWEIVPGSRTIETIGNGRLLHLKVRAVVALLPVIRRLSDIADVYADLERPRIRVAVTGDTADHAAQNALTAALQAQGFEIATGGTAEIVLAGHIEATQTVHLGDTNAMYGVGESVAACRARLNVQLVSEASEESLLAAQSEGAGSSFQSDGEAKSASVRAAVSDLLAQESGAILPRLLVRWAREWQEGHVVAVKITGLDAKHFALLRSRLQEMRGFCRFLPDNGDTKTTTLRFVTRLDTRAVRSRLTALRLDNLPLTVQTRRGPVILCAVRPRPRTARR